LACRTNPCCRLDGGLDRGNYPNLVRHRFSIQFWGCHRSRPPFHYSWISLPEPLLSSPEKAFRTTEIAEISRTVSTEASDKWPPHLDSPPTPGPSFDIQFPYLNMRPSGVFDRLWSNPSENLKHQSIWNFELPERV